MLIPSLRLPLCASISTQVTEQEALTLWYVGTHTSPIHPGGELTLGQWDEGTVFFQVAIGFSPRLGLWPRRVLLGTMGTWKHMDRTWRERRVDRNGGSLAVPTRSLMAQTITARWLRVFSGGLGSPLARQTGAEPGSGVPGPKSDEREIRGCPALGSSTDVLKSKEDPFGGSSVAGAMLPQVGLGRGVLLASGTRKRKEDSPSLLPRF